jgi:two-component system phosphate regulon sensor histidine kinase PhoR
MMFWRVITFFSFQATGALGGWLLDMAFHGIHAALWGGWLGAVLWLMLDTSRAATLLRCLRFDMPPGQTLPSGIWGDVFDRTLRLLRSKDNAICDCQKRLQDFLSALQASPNGVILLDSQNRIEWCNQTAAAHFGLDARRDMAQTIGNLVRDPGFATYLASRNFEEELILPGRGHSPHRPIRLSVQLYPYGGGRFLLLSRDVTALEQAEAMRRDFVANVSHEIRTPLTVLTGFVETLQTLALSQQEQEHYLVLMAQQSVRMQTLVDDLLTLSHLEGSPVPDSETWGSIPILMRQVEQDAQALMQSVFGHDQPHHLSFDCQCHGVIAGIFQELHSAMINLVSNAIRYTPSGGRIGVMMRPLPDGRAVFEVTDNGPGIAPEHLPRLTERFYRVDRSRSRETGGTGLGLAIVKHVVQRHGATLTIASTPGQGSKFCITFEASRLRLNECPPVKFV